jgi:hypothetical protein
MAAAAVPARAQAPPEPAPVPLSQSISDPNGRFTMSFPSDWEVVTRAAGGIPLLGAGPAYAGARPIVNVVAESLPQPMSPEELAAEAERDVKATLHNYKSFGNRVGAVQGRPAYYRFITWETATGVVMYMVQVFLTQGDTGFVLTGGTVNEPERVLHDMPTITRIIETFRLAQPPGTN